MANDSTTESTVKILTVMVGCLFLFVVVCMIGMLALWWAYLSKPTESVESSVAEIAIRSKKNPDGAISIRESGISDLRDLPDQWQSEETDSPSSLTFMSYKFDPQQSVSFDYQNIIRLGGLTIQNEGRIQYRVHKLPVEEFINQLGESERQQLQLQGNGSGFVVHPGGIIATCAHVVEGVSRVNLTIAGAQYKGRVIAVDQDHDLALIKVNASNLSFLPISTSRTKLGDSARVFGFPLAKQLGRSLKMASGSVSGRDRVDEMSVRLQLDATANPGNSGGPVTDDNGKVIGVVDSILASDSLADMSFAIPAEELVGFLDSLDISCLELSGDDELVDNGSLAISSLDRVGEAVALIEVGTREQMKNWRLISFSGYNLSQREQKGVRLLVNGEKPKSKRSFEGQLIVDSKGGVHYCSEFELLPVLFEDFPTIGIMPLPELATTRWQASETMLLKREYFEKQQNSRNQFFLPFGVPKLDRFGRRSYTKSKVKNLFTVVSISNEFQAESNSLGLKLLQTRKIKSKQLGDKELDFDVTHELTGESIFNKRVGWFDRGVLQGDFEAELSGKLEKGDILFEFDRVNQNESDNERAKDAIEIKYGYQSIAEKKAMKASELGKLDKLNIRGPGLDLYEPEK